MSHAFPSWPQADLARGYAVPPIIVGCWQLSTSHRDRPLDREQVVADLLSLSEAGFTTFDGADIYGGVEETLGELLARTAQKYGSAAADSLRIHTKFVPDRDRLARIDKKSVESVIDRSRRRLNRETLDLVQFHWWDFEIRHYVETAIWLDELRRDGKIRHLGVTNFDPSHLREIQEAGVPIISNQVQYSLLDRRPQNGLVEFCTAHNLHLLAYGTLAGGLLSDRFLGIGSPPKATNRSQVKYALIVEEFGGWSLFQDLLFVLKKVADKHNVTIANVAGRSVLDKPRVASMIVGTSSAAHLQSNCKTLRLVLDDEDRDRIGRVTSRSRGPRGDIYELERIAGGRHAAIMRMNLNRELPG